MKFIISIHHLDPDEEQDKILSCFEKDGIIPKCEFKDASNDRNSITIDVCTDNNLPELKKVLSKISKHTLETISKMDLSISIMVCVHPVEKMKTLPSGMVQVSDETSFISREILQILCDKNIDLYIHAFGDERV